MAVFFAPSVSACGRCWMLMDGACWWCSTWCCLRQVYGTETASPLERMLYSYILLLGLLWLATSWFISIYFWWLCMLSFLTLFVFGKERRISSKEMTKARKDFIQKSRQRKNATEDESNLPHMLASRWKQPATHACKLVFTNTRQQATIMSDNRKTKNQVKK